MEGGRTQQQPAQGPPRWLGFAAWLRQHAGGPPEEAVSEASASDAEEADLPLAAEQQPQQVQQQASSGGRAAGGLAAAPARGEPQLARHATALAPRLPDCRAETRLTSDSSSRARQEMTVLLAAPGMPLHQAPVLTARQATALVSAICEPLLSLPVGRLTRKLSAPTKLQPTEDRGVLSLWLLPDDSLSLVWQSAQQLGAAAVDEAVGAASPSSSSSSSGDLDGSGSVHASGSSQQPPLQQSCSVAVWEELAHFPAQAHLLDDTPVVTIHMLRGDASGRSFYIRVRDDVAEANLEAATAAVPDASRMLQQQRAAAGGAASAAAAAAAGVDPSVALEPQGAPRMYFWLADKDLGKAVYSLGRLKSLLKRPPTLSKRSGVPERQLAQLGAWVQRADQAAAEQQRAAAAAQQQRQQSEAGSPPPAGQLQPGSSDAAALAGGRAPHLPPLLQGGPGGPGLLLGQPGGMAAAAHVQGSMAALLPAPLPAAVQAGGSEGAEPSSGSSPPVAASTSTVSATAAALYQDHRFNVVCPCTISVVVGMRVQAAGANPATLPAAASSRARAVAERHAKCAVDRSGRQRIEERLAEVVIRNIRAQRNRARQARQAQRDSAARAAAAERALALARRATGRALPAPAAAQAAPAVPAQQQPTPPASAEAAAAAALLPLDQQQAAAGSLVPPPAGSPFACRSSSGGSELAAPASSERQDADANDSRAFSSPAAVPMAAPPAPLLPGGRVTIGNLQSILAPPQAGSRARQGATPASLGSAPAAATGTARDGSAAKPSARVTVADLADLLGKHAKLE
ncbi:hypothetical protein ABPG75_007558 [Micractinium tetrahymenae]